MFTSAFSWFESEKCVLVTRTPSVFGLWKKFGDRLSVCLTCKSVQLFAIVSINLLETSSHFFESAREERTKKKMERFC